MRLQERPGESVESSRTSDDVDSWSASRLWASLLGQLCVFFLFTVSVLMTVSLVATPLMPGGFVLQREPVLTLLSVIVTLFLCVLWMAYIRLSSYLTILAELRERYLD